MRVKSIALWVLAVLLAAALFYFFRGEMARQDARHVGFVVLPPIFSAVS